MFPAMSVAKHQTVAECRAEGPLSAAALGWLLLEGRCREPGQIFKLSFVLLPHLILTASEARNASLRLMSQTKTNPQASST